MLQSYLGQMVWPDYRKFNPVETAFMDVGNLIGGEALLYGISFVLLVGGLASAITGQASASRLLFGMGRDRLLPYRIFGFIHPKLGTPVYSVLLMGVVHLLGAMLLKYTEAAELVNFGALIGFMCVNLSVARYFHLRQGRPDKGGLAFNFLLPFLGFLVCFYIWLNLSHFSMKLGIAWMGLGFLYLLFLTRGFSRRLAELKL